jgi:hypothetical protein
MVAEDEGALGEDRVRVGVVAEGVQDAGHQGVPPLSPLVAVDIRPHGDVIAVPARGAQLAAQQIRGIDLHDDLRVEALARKRSKNHSMRTHRRSVCSLAAPLLPTVLLLAGCGGAAVADSSTSSRPPAEQPTHTAEEPAPQPDPAWDLTAKPIEDTVLVDWSATETTEYSTYPALQAGVLEPASEEAKYAVQSDIEMTTGEPRKGTVEVNEVEDE